MYQEKLCNSLEHIVAGACRLAASGAEVRAVHVITRRRPAYQELLRYREQAEANGLTMTVLGGGGVVLRPRANTPSLPVKHGKRISGPDDHAD